MRWKLPPVTKKPDLFNSPLMSRSPRNARQDQGPVKGGAQYEDAWPKKIKKGAVKGKNKGKKQKGKGRQHVKGGLNVMGQTPDQRMLCFKWNDGQDCDGSCNMVHACRVKDCYKADHPMIKHPGFDESKGFWFA